VYDEDCEHYNHCVFFFFVKVFYTCDAGPNPVLFVEEANMLNFLEFLYDDPICLLDVPKNETSNLECEPREDSNEVPYVPFVSSDSSVDDRVKKMLQEKKGGKCAKSLASSSALGSLQRISHTTPGPCPLVSVGCKLFCE
jgi:hypothetical protein